MADNTDNKETRKPVGFKDTLNLPHTDFPIRPNASIDDQNMLDRWQKEELYQKSFKAHEGAEKYVLHVGPPFANGHIHLGHAYNGILKDIITKAHRMSGRHTPVTPGWDCHGLPVEIKVGRENPGLDRVELKKACRKYAQQWVDIQKNEFRRLGIVMNWDHPYLTMSPDYESAIVKAFGKFYKNGFIERKNKSVAWCISCKTVLAAAEIEYEDRKDPSIYVRFPFEIGESEELFPEAQKQEVSLLVWTTTPWTLPLNRAVVLKKGAEYTLAKIKNKLVIVGSQTLPALEKATGESAQIVKAFPAEYLAGQKVSHPFIERATPIIIEEAVGVDEGTACVHCAPGCGQIDYEWGIKHKLEIYSPISDDGKYTHGIEPETLKNISVTEALGTIITLLADRLFHKSSITHSYPHCWRCRNGLIFRATKQWFLNLEHNHLRRLALEAIEHIAFNPSQARNFLRATVASRSEWCISRQRIWGVPIPALLCAQCDAAYVDQSLVDVVTQGIKKEGIEFWERVTVEELMHAAGIKDALACPVCKAHEFKKERDILDVWFESGLSHYAVLFDNPDLQFPADIYLEGVDQHRGWFQSSLLTALVLEKSAPMKTIMTHGFTVDEKGRKMSKSLGNVTAPQELIDKLGTDGLRLWVSSIGNEGDAVVSPVVLANVGEVFRKIRNTLRFLIANLYDFDATRDCPALKDMLLIDRAILASVHELNNELITHYKSGNFTAVFHGLAEFCASELSARYLDIIKDRLYVEAATGKKRRSAQTACYYLLDTLTRLIAPVMSFTAEQLSDLYQKNKPGSIHLQKFADLRNIREYIASRANEAVDLIPGCDFQLGFDPKRTYNAIASIDYESLQASLWDYMHEIRSAILKAIEVEREKGLIKHPLEAQLTLYFDPNDKKYALLQYFMNELKESGQSLEDFMKEFCIVSQVTVTQKPLEATLEPTTDTSGLSIKVEKAAGEKCPRCWNWDDVIDDRQLCRRCAAIVKNSNSI